MPTIHTIVTAMSSGAFPKGSARTSTATTATAAPHSAARRTNGLRFSRSSSRPTVRMTIAAIATTMTCPGTSGRNGQTARAATAMATPPR